VILGRKSALLYLHEAIRSHSPSSVLDLQFTVLLRVLMSFVMVRRLNRVLWESGVVCVCVCGRECLAVISRSYLGWACSYSCATHGGELLHVLQAKSPP